MRSPRAVLFALVALGTGVASCSVLSPVTPQDRFNGNRAAWRVLGIHTYEYTLAISCFCTLGSPALVTVRQDTVVRVIDIASGDTLGAGVAAQYPSVDSLFGVIQHAMDVKAAKLDVQYDGAYHYPSSISIDYSKNAADDQVSYTASDLKPAE